MEGEGRGQRRSPIKTNSGEIGSGRTTWLRCGGTKTSGNPSPPPDEEWIQDVHRPLIKTGEMA